MPITQSVVTLSRAHSPVLRALVRRPLYVVLSVLIGAIAILGFWATYFGPLVRGTPNQPTLIHVHAAVFVGWLALLLTQTMLAAVGRVSAHRTLGHAGIWYGVLLVLIGVWTAVSRSAFHMRTGGPGEQLLFVALLDMMIFAPFFGAAIAYRRKPQVHKRLMVVAATMLLIAAVGRFWFLPAPPLELFVATAIWFSPVLVAMAHDWVTVRRVHPVYVLGLAAFFVRLLSPSLVIGSPAWSSLAQMIAGASGAHGID
jgi:hypothetical protein